MSLVKSHFSFLSVLRKHSKIQSNSDLPSFLPKLCADDHGEVNINQTSSQS